MLALMQNWMDDLDEARKIHQFQFLHLLAWHPPSKWYLLGYQKHDFQTNQKTSQRQSKQGCTPKRP